MRFARRVFFWAGVYGFVVLTPMLFMERLAGQGPRGPVNLPENYYGFLCAALVWQLAFLIISRDPPPYRPLMVACVLEKWTFAMAVAILYAQGRAPSVVAGFAAVDALLGVLFVLAWRSIGPEARTGRSPATAADSRNRPASGPATG